MVLPELASIRIAAHEESGRLLGHRVLPVVGLCPGYRHVNLRTELGLPLPASLFLLVVVKVSDPERPMLGSTNANAKGSVLEKIQKNRLK